MADPPATGTEDANFTMHEAVLVLPLGEEAYANVDCVVACDLEPGRPRPSAWYGRSSGDSRSSGRGIEQNMVHLTAGDAGLVTRCTESYAWALRTSWGVIYLLRLGKLRPKGQFG
ncbi:hypothetical protein TrVE_jg767 [Triparma verrucosa]|uniref:Uncharacterized protein n=1 Tax=Triparma verrucosa TaxID=1606542 RepID=A0A9W7FBY4_9STRA|nr:hypothetical protein TrVE_jg767 [Triparma verrucosa]